MAWREAGGAAGGAAAARASRIGTADSARSSSNARPGCGSRSARFRSIPSGGSGAAWPVASSAPSSPTSCSNPRESARPTKRPSDSSRERSSRGWIPRASRRDPSVRTTALAHRPGAASPSARVPFSQPRSFLSNDCRKLLRAGEILLDFFLGPHRSLLFAITRETCRAVALPADVELEPKIRLYPRLVARPPSPAATAAGRRRCAQARSAAGGGADAAPSSFSARSRI